MCSFLNNLFIVSGNNNTMYSKHRIGNRNVHSKLPIVVFQINSISSIESEEFRETCNLVQCPDNMGFKTDHLLLIGHTVAISAITNSFEILNILSTIHSFSSIHEWLINNNSVEFPNDTYNWSYRLIALEIHEWLSQVTDLLTIIIQAESNSYLLTIQYIWVLSHVF